MFVATGVTGRDLAAKRRKILRKAGKQILLIAAKDRIFAIANRCPHEGYPLSEGTEGAGCVLTCNWHNWKFDLATGAALIGRDPVRTYPVELLDGEIFIDLSDPPADEQKRRALEGLDGAMADGDMARIAREVARLERAGFDANTALIHAFERLNERLENGMTHAHAAAADWLSLSARAPSAEARLAAMLEPLGHLAWDTAGAGHFPYAEETARWSSNEFLTAMENEDEAGAIAFIRGAIAERISYVQLCPVLAEAALSHYADFGHSAIYTLKAGQLIAHLGDEAAEFVLLALVRQLIQATREERLPEFRAYDKALDAWDGKGKEKALTEDFIGLSVDAILKRMLASSERPQSELYDALLGAAAWNLAHFDIDLDRASNNALADNVSWLDFTHALTFANAVRHLCQGRPDLWSRALLQMALFAGRNRSYVKESIDPRNWHVPDRNTFIAREMGALFDHGIVEPIVAFHRLKVLFALEDELHAAPDAPWADAMCTAVNRFLNIPMKRHHGLRIAAQARDFIAREG